MKKFIVFAVVLALLVPAAAFAAAEFSLGGFIKMDTMWDSDGGVGKIMSVPPARNNDGNKHGRLKFTAQGSRFNFTIKGPKLWGANITGYLEMDFDAAEAGVANAGFSPSAAYTPRLRHAMFRFNWPTSELMLGQYWSMFCEYYAEAAEDGPGILFGTPTARLAQIRFTQKFMSDWTVAALIGNPNQAILGGVPAALGNAVTGSAGGAFGPYNAAINSGQSAETPQVQAKITFAHDFWGKAAYYGKPIPFTAQFVAGWQRNVLREGTGTALFTLLNDRAVVAAPGDVRTAAVINTRNQYLDPWMVMGSFFIPVIPTHSANLAGTASILTQWWIGQGVEAFGFAGVGGNLFKFSSNIQNGATTHVYEAQLLKKFGGFVQGQYYFNNQWFVNALYGVSKAYGVSRSRYNFGPVAVAGLNGMEWAMGDNAQTIQQMSATLWYRPIQAIKFGLQYSYTAAHYFAYALPGPSRAGAPLVTNNAMASVAAPANTANRSNFGDSHRVEFVGFFYF